MSNQEKYKLLFLTSSAFFIRLSGAFLAFLLSVSISRLLGAGGVGIYISAMAIIVIASTVAQLGLNNALLRFIATHAQEENWPLVKGVYQLGVSRSLFAGVLLAGGLFLASSVIATHFFGKPDMAAVLRVSSLAVVTHSMMNIHADCLKGLERIRFSVLVSSIIYPFVALLLVWPLVTEFGVTGAALSYVLGTGFAALLGTMIWRRLVYAYRGIRSFDRGTLSASARPLMLSSLINQAMLPWVPVLMLGFWSSTTETGLLGMALLVSNLLNMLLQVVASVLAARFVAKYEQGDIEGIGRLARFFALALTLVSSPILFVMIFADGWVMNFFGSDFVTGGPALAILALGQLVNILTASVSYVLMMTGHERDNRNAAIFCLLLMMGLGLFLIPAFGLIGASITIAGSLATRNLLCVYFVWLRLGIITLPIRL